MSEKKEAIGRRIDDLKKKIEKLESQFQAHIDKAADLKGEDPKSRAKKEMVLSQADVCRENISETKMELQGCEELFKITD